MLNQKYLLRPSVSVIPVDEAKNTYQFFLSNTRQKVLVKILDTYLLDFILSLDGSQTLSELIKIKGYEQYKNNIVAFSSYLLSKNIIEKNDIFEKNNQLEFRRVLNFIADFVPSDNIEDVWYNIQSSVVIIVGVGAIGGWVADFLVGMGVQNFIFIDDDIVNISNLNRSIYKTTDIGKYKADCLTTHLKNKNATISSIIFYEKVLEIKTIAKAVDAAKKISTNIVVINCGDYPNVDITSAMVNTVCLTHTIPYIIAGGYNLHLSLLGNTVMPFESACFECIKASLNEANAHEMEGLVKLERKDRNIGSLAPLAIVSASMAANEAIRVVALSKYLRPAMINRRGEFNFIHNRISYIEFSRRIDCEACGTK